MCVCVCVCVCVCEYSRRISLTKFPYSDMWVNSLTHFSFHVTSQREVFVLADLPQPEEDGWQEDLLYNR